MIFGVGGDNLIEAYSLSAGSISGAIGAPAGFTVSAVATDDAGQVYVGGYTGSYNEVLVYAAGSTTIGPPSVSPIRTLQISGVAAPGTGSYPTSITVDAKGNIYALIASSTSVYELAANSVGLTVPRIITPSNFSTSTSITTDAANNLYVLGSAGTSTVIDVFPASATVTQPTSTLTVSALAASGIAVDGSGNVYVLGSTSNGAQVEMFAAGLGSATPSKTLTLPLPAGASLTGVGSVQVDRGGNIYAAAAIASATLNDLQLYGFAPTGTVPFLDASESAFGTTLAVY